MEEEVTIPCHTLESHPIAIKPRNMTSTSTVMSIPMINKPRNETSATTVTTTTVTNFTSASQHVKVIDALDVSINDNPDINTVDSTLTAQTPLETPTYNLPPVEQQDILHNFFHYIDQGTFGIPCGGKIYCPLPGMDPVAWPQEKSVCLPRTLAQLACQDFKKEPQDNFAIMPSPQYLIIPCLLQQLVFGAFIGNQLPWLNCNLSDLPIYYPMSTNVLALHADSKSMRTRYLRASLIQCYRTRATSHGARLDG